MKWNIGQVEISQIIEMEGGELIQDSIPSATAANIKKIDWLFPNFTDKDGKLKALVQSFLIRSNGKNILIDTCNGNGKNRPTCPTWGNLNTDFLHTLNETGVKESDIDVVICTHLHFDHVGWNTKKENKAWIPTFPNAKYLFNEDEFNYWKQKPEKEVDDDKFAFDDSVSPIVEAGLSQVVNSNYRIDKNISLISTPGHTPGHISVVIESDGKKAIISGDFLHHPCQLENPEWTMLADTLPDKALKTRKEMLEKLVDTKVLFIGTHFANPVAGFIKHSNNGYRLE